MAQYARLVELGRIASHSGNWSDELAYHIALAQQAGSDYARPLQLALSEASIQTEGTWVHTVDPAYASYTIAVAGATLTQEQTDDADWEQMAETEADDALAAEEADISAAQTLDGAIIADAVTWVTSVAQAGKAAADGMVDAGLAFITGLAGQLQSLANTTIDAAVAETQADDASKVAFVAAQGAAELAAVGAVTQPGATLDADDQALLQLEEAYNDTLCQIARLRGALAGTTDPAMQQYYNDQIQSLMNTAAEQEEQLHLQGTAQQVFSPPANNQTSGKGAHSALLGVGAAAALVVIVDPIPGDEVALLGGLAVRTVIRSALGTTIRNAVITGVRNLALMTGGMYLASQSGHDGEQLQPDTQRLLDEVNRIKENIRILTRRQQELQANGGTEAEIAEVSDAIEAAQDYLGRLSGMF
jgi:hypothetical protein